jgi:outer membrane protein OmpA-like peptidoglycan-associated protein
MNGKLPVAVVLGLFCSSGAWPQNIPAHRENIPIYQVTVIERTVKAVDYQYRQIPTRVDFKGTVLLPHGRGEAVVESKRGRTEIEAKFERVEAPARFGHEYLTYVLWAITAEGHPKNLGEVLANGSDRAHLHVTTDLQAFGMIVTAEPYSAVRQPSDVVVMENEIRPDTIGATEAIQPKYELLPRGHYTYTVPDDLQAAGRNAPTLPMDQYEALVQLYEAQNAVQIAKAVGADRYAAETYNRAEDLLRSARQMQDRKGDRSALVTTARQAAQTAEDARMIAMKRQQDDELQNARDQAALEQQRRIQAEGEAQRARNEGAADRASLDAERSARQRAEAEAGSLSTPQPLPANPAPAVVTTQPAANRQASQKMDTRMKLLQQISRVFPARDTPRGLVVTVSDADFRGTMLHPVLLSRLSTLGAIIATEPGLSVEVEGHLDRADEQSSYMRAAAVRDALTRGGIPQASISARGMGNSRPLVSNAAAGGRERNRRVEITISGDAIGSMATWDKSYAVAPRQ